MYQLSCGEIWGGIRNCDDDVASAGLTTSLYSVASDGGKGGDIYYLSLCENNTLTRMVLADVIGHGEDVSKISKMIYQAIKSHMNDVEEDTIISELNQTALEIGRDAMTTLVMVKVLTENEMKKATSRSDSYLRRLYQHWETLTGMYAAFEEQTPMMEFHVTSGQIRAYLAKGLPGEDYGSDAGTDEETVRGGGSKGGPNGLRPRRIREDSSFVRLPFGKRRLPLGPEKKRAEQCHLDDFQQ